MSVSSRTKLPLKPIAQLQPLVSSKQDEWDKLIATLSNSEAKYEKANAYTLEVCSDAIKNARNPQQVIDALKQLINIEKIRPNTYILNQVIAFFNFNKNFSNAKKFFDIACHLSLADSVTFKNTIYAAGCVELAINVFKQALALQPPLPHLSHVYEAMINIAGEDGCIELARFIFTKAVGTENANDKVYAAMISAAGYNARLDIAGAIYNSICNTPLMTEKVHNCMISAAVKNGRLDLAKVAYENAVNANKAGIITHNFIMSAYLEAKQLNEAEAVYKDSGLSLQGKNKYRTVPIVDLHGWSYAAVYIGIGTHLRDATQPVKFDLITGKGLHSHLHTPNETHAVKRAVQDLSRELRCTLVEDSKNSGKSYLTYNPRGKKVHLTAKEFKATRQLAKKNKADKELIKLLLPPPLQRKPVTPFRPQDIKKLLTAIKAERKALDIADQQKAEHNELIHLADMHVDNETDHELLHLANLYNDEKPNRAAMFRKNDEQKVESTRCFMSSKCTIM